MPQIVQPDRLLRDELLVYQRRALRDWKADAWFAANRPRQSLALDEHAPDDLWLDLSGGGPITDAEPGAVVVGSYAGIALGPNGAVEPTAAPTRSPDLSWNLADGIPAETRTVDRLFVDADRPPTNAAAELSRVAVAGGLAVLRGKPDNVTKLARALEREGWTVEEEADALGHARIHQTRVSLRLGMGSVPLGDVGPANIREVVMGETIPERRRQPSRW